MIEQIVTVLAQSSPQAVAVGVVAWVTIRRSIADVDTRVQAVEARVATLHADTRALLERVEAHFDRLEARLDAHSDRISRLEGRLLVPPVLPTDEDPTP